MQGFGLVKVVLFVAWAYSSLADDDDSPVITLPGLGKLRGKSIYTAWTGREVTSFVDIKYAESTGGAHRFKPPIPVRPWRGIRNATESKNSCPSVVHLSEFEDGEEIPPEIEDCLTLTVSSQNLTAKQPVMVFIHGEYLYEGNNLEGAPEYLLEKDVVLVTPQYRLGPFGFLSTLTEDIPGNAAVFDVIFALEWVHKYISYFGGDPARVTLIGQVGSAAIVHLLTFSPAVPRNLFHQVIYHSGAATMPTFLNDNPVGFARKIGETAGCERKSSIDDLNECLIDLSPLELLEAFRDYVWDPRRTIEGSYGGVFFTVGDPFNVLPMDPTLMLLENTNYSYPTMGGTPKNAGTRAMKEMFDSNFGGVAPDDIFKGHDYINYILKQTVGSKGIGQLADILTSDLFTPEILNNGTFEAMVPGIIDLAGTVLYKSAVLFALKRNANFLPEQTFLYSFDYRGEFNRYIDTDEEYYKNTPFIPGVSLTDENIYLFPYPGQADLLNTLDTVMAVNMVELWTSFAKNGRPSMDGLENWPAMTGKNGPYLKIDIDMQIGEDYFDEFSATARDESNGTSILSKYYEYNPHNTLKDPSSDYQYQ